MIVKMTNIRYILSLNMKNRRKALGLSQNDLAERIGTATNYISKIEAEKQFPSVKMIENIAAALEIDTIELFSMKKIQEKNLEDEKTKLINELSECVNLTFLNIKDMS